MSVITRIIFAIFVYIFILYDKTMNKISRSNLAEIYALGYLCIAKKT
jgi:hypothetical protein